MIISLFEIDIERLFDFSRDFLGLKHGIIKEKILRVLIIVIAYNYKCKSR